MSRLTIGSVPGISAPKSVKQITSEASEYEFNALVPLKYWKRTADALSKQAESYMREGDDEMVYFLLFRHAHLVLTNLSNHPEYNTKDLSIQALKRQVKDELAMLDVLKPRLERNYDAYIKYTSSHPNIDDQDEVHDGQYSRHKVGDRSDGMYAQAELPQQINGEDDIQYVTSLAREEFSRTANSNRRIRHGDTMHTQNTLVEQMQAIHSRVEPLYDQSTSSVGARHESAQVKSGLNYPGIPVLHQQRRRSPPRYDSPARQSSLQAPLRPAKEYSQPAPSPPSQPTESATSTNVTKPRQTGPIKTFAPGAYLESGDPLRSIFLPTILRTTFLSRAYKNTKANLETCGFLCGTLRANALFVTTLVIPQQTATSDTCEMTNESDLFDYIDRHDLMVLGWIHTHPTQTCFMSSRDLHTHAGYQMMLAESIAIVCAPSKGDIVHGGDWNIFRLTDPPGKMSVLECQKEGLFHDHGHQADIYTGARKPGHVTEVEEMKFDVVDMR